ncbi:MAG: hypothetical protein NZ873_01375 [Crenarchaeota archaeon]|nr:hypothetical protein [Thermoproteota archaeon]MDW8033990.1 hypothetical protein [Nitrososphaerota archaeon]
MEERLSLVETPVGLIVFNDEEVASYAFNNFEEAVSYYRGEVVRGVASFLRKWKGRIIFVERRSAVSTLSSIGLKPIVREPLDDAVKLRSDFETILKILGLSVEEYKSFMLMVANKLAQDKINELAKRKDLDIVMALQSYDELVKIMNVIQDRIIVWIRERAPSLLEENKDFEKIIERICFGNFESDYVKKMAELYLKSRECRNIVEKQIGDFMEETAPNVASVIGPILGARLISKVGSLARLASLPASTIQILGAEKALFRALKKRGKPPKHGIIFQHPWVHGSPRKIRGKVARLLASRIAVAARVDYFSGRFIGEELKRELENRIKALRGGAS